MITGCILVAFLEACGITATEPKTTLILNVDFLFTAIFVRKNESKCIITQQNEPVTAQVGAVTKAQIIYGLYWLWSNSALSNRKIVVITFFSLKISSSALKN